MILRYQTEADALRKMVDDLQLRQQSQQVEVVEDERIRELQERLDVIGSLVVRGGRTNASDAVYGSDDEDHPRVHSSRTPSSSSTATTPSRTPRRRRARPRTPPTPVPSRPINGTISALTILRIFLPKSSSSPIARSTRSPENLPLAPPSPLPRPPKPNSSRLCNSRLGSWKRYAKRKPPTPRRRFGRMSNANMPRACRRWR